MDSNWLCLQTLKNTEQWDRSLTTYYPQAKLWMKDSVSYFKHLTEVCNYLNATKLVDWDKYIVNDAMILDIGCGGGWLTGYLSKNSKVRKIIAIDSSANYIDNYLPGVVSQLSGDMYKIQTVQGLFAPILLDSESVDAIVISSALHHADSLSGVLEEFKRVLKPNSYLIILNETPGGNFRFIYQQLRSVVKMFAFSIFRVFRPFSQKISAGSFLYDPYLGDVDYPPWYWKKAINVSGFDLIEFFDTKLPTISNSKGRSLKHFICKKK